MILEKHKADKGHQREEIISLLKINPICSFILKYTNSNGSVKFGQFVVGAVYICEYPMETEQDQHLYH